MMAVGLISGRRVYQGSLRENFGEDEAERFKRVWNEGYIGFEKGGSLIG